MNYRHSLWYCCLLTMLIFQIDTVRIAHSAEQTLSLNVKANVVENSCKISFSDSGSVDLGKQSIAAIESVDSFTNYIGNGKHFSINVSDCSPLSNGGISKLIFNFSPQSGTFPVESSQAFANDILPADGGATGVGLVIFAEQQDKNVLDESGHSNAIFDVTSDTYLNSYGFFARLQKINTITEGNFTTHVTVEVTYE
ncbi:fimbrial protein [Salmonella enterica]|nr:fimbrial protein [Salmonella enterica]